jgi:hypothetical protein
MMLAVTGLLLALTVVLFASGTLSARRAAISERPISPR